MSFRDALLETETDIKDLEIAADKEELPFNPSVDLTPGDHYKVEWDLKRNLDFAQSHLIPNHIRIDTSLTLDTLAELIYLNSFTSNPQTPSPEYWGLIREYFKQEIEHNSPAFAVFIAAQAKQLGQDFLLNRSDGALLINRVEGAHTQAIFRPYKDPQRLPEDLRLLYARKILWPQKSEYVTPSMHNAWLNIVQAQKKDKFWVDFTEMVAMMKVLAPDNIPSGLMDSQTYREIKRYISQVGDHYPYIAKGAFNLWIIASPEVTVTDQGLSISASKEAVPGEKPTIPPVRGY